MLFFFVIDTKSDFFLFTKSCMTKGGASLEELSISPKMEGAYPSSISSQNRCGLFESGTNHVVVTRVNAAREP